MLEKITSILREFKGDDSLVVTEETTFEELGIDSLDSVELVMSIEDEFDITIEMSADTQSIGDLIKSIDAA
ncbi:MAG: phosphopantetheine-binding protein [Coriobacteriia bacterium]|nr:phosphopantetheine-binding protein [Coriobacteriia bacterium]